MTWGTMVVRSLAVAALCLLALRAVAVHSVGAVPEVVTRATGRRDSRARPNAKKPMLRSSVSTWALHPGCSAMARARGVEREPGATQTAIAAMESAYTRLFTPRNWR